MTFEQKRRVVLAESFMFDRKIMKTVDLAEIESGRIKVRDESAAGPLFSNFYLGGCPDLKSL